MASAAQIKALLQSHGHGDNARFYAVALQVAAAEARAGHSKLARDIRELVEKAKGRQNEKQANSSILHLAQPQGEAAELLEPIQSDLRVNNLVLTPTLKERIERIVAEQQNFNRLKEHNLRPRQRLLFTGPPGCGKTMTASALSTELGLPLFVIRLDTLISRYLGDSLSKLRVIFDTANETRAIYFFDEFDSIGYTRDSPSEVGEMRRLLNSFLLFIERLSSNSLIIAATNHGQRLDKALYRRFDDLIEFGLPGDNQIKQVIQDRLAGVQSSSLSWPKVLPAAKGLSYAEITRACEEAVKGMLISQKRRVVTQMLVDALTERRLFLNH